MNARRLVLALLPLALLTTPTARMQVDVPQHQIAPATLADQATQASAFASRQLLATAKRFSSSQYPDYTDSEGVWVTSSASGWTSGFFPGSLWLAYEQSGDPALLAAAKKWTAGLESQKTRTDTHDLGFMFFSSYGNAYRLTNDDAYRKVLLRAAESLAGRYSSVVGCTRSWDRAPADFYVLIDNMINLELLFWAAKHGGKPEWYNMAVSHALKTRANHIRPDGSSYQIVVYDPQTGQIKRREAHQGYSVDSTWSRGQSWAIYGFTVAYRETGDARFLETARAAADYFIAHMPADGVPYWDFQAPDIPQAPRDSSAAAAAAAGLLELSTLDGGTRGRGYYTAATSILTALTGPPYLAEGSDSQAIVLHGTPNHNRDRFDRGTSYGDYYLLQALQRYRVIVPPPTATPTASATTTLTSTSTATASPTGSATAAMSSTATDTSAATATVLPTATRTPGELPDSQQIELPLLLAGLSSLHFASSLERADFKFDTQNLA